LLKRGRKASKIAYGLKDCLDGYLSIPVNFSAAGEFALDAVRTEKKA